MGTDDLLWRELPWYYLTQTLPCITPTQGSGIQLIGLYAAYSLMGTRFIIVKVKKKKLGVRGS